MVKAVIFDLDGVLVDTEPLWFEIYSKVCKDYGFKFTEGLDSKLARGRSNAVVRLTDFFGISDKHSEFSKKVSDGYKDLFARKAKLIPGVENLLEDLKGKFKLALATSASRYRLGYNLEKFPQLESYFSTFTTGDEVKESKPAPDIFLLTAKKLGVKAVECLVIEDSQTGVAAAKAAGMRVIGFRPRHVYKQDLSKADRVVESLSDIDQEDLLPG